MKKICVFLLALFLIQVNSSVLAQATIKYSKQTKLIADAIEDADNKLWASCQQRIDMYRSDPIPRWDDEFMLWRMRADFYYATAAARLKHSNAIELLQQFKIDYPSNTFSANVSHLLGMVYMDNNNKNNAIIHFNEVDPNGLSEEELDEFYFLSGYAHFQRENYIAARTNLEKTANYSNPYQVPSVYYMGFVELKEGNMAAAKDYFLMIVDEPEFREDVALYLTQIDLMEGRCTQVTRHLEPLIDAAPRNKQAAIKGTLGQAYFCAEDCERATPLLEEYIESLRDPEYALFYQVGYCSYKSGQYEKAITYLKELTSANSDSMRQHAMYTIANSYLEMDDKENAKAYFQNAAGTGPDERLKELATVQYIRLSDDLGDHSQSIALIETFLELYPTSAYRDELLELLLNATLHSQDYTKGIQVIEDLELNSAAFQGIYQRLTLYSAVEALNSKAYNEAIGYALKSQSRNIDNSLFQIAHLIMGDAKHLQGLYSEARGHYAQFSMTNVDNSEFPWAVNAYASYGIAYTYFKEKDYDNAANKLKVAYDQLEQAQFPKAQAFYRDAILRRADCLFMEHEYSTSQDLYLEVYNRNFPKDDYALYQAGLIDGFNNNLSSKIMRMDKLAIDFPQSTYRDDAAFESSDSYFALSELDNAKRGFLDFVSNHKSSPYNPVVYSKLGLIYETQNQYNEAANWYKKTISDFPGTPSANGAVKALERVYLAMGQPQAFVDFINSQSGITLNESKKDSLLFTNAMNFYKANDYPKAARAFEDYLMEFSRGFHHLEVNSYAAECYFEMAKADNNPSYFDRALPFYQTVISEGSGSQLETALVRAGFITFNHQKRYGLAQQYYNQLSEMGSIQSNIELALEGFLRSSIELQDNVGIVTAFERIQATPTMSKDIQDLALFSGAKAYYQQGNIQTAQSMFEDCIQRLDMSSNKAESAWHLAKITYDDGRFDEAKEASKGVISSYGSYSYWVVKAYILIGDCWIGLENYNEAILTLESIVNNYQGDQGLIDEASQKLERARTLERQKDLEDDDNSETQD